MKTILILTVLSPALLIAGPRSSSQYAIPAEANDAGGGVSSSAAYLNHGNIGGFGGISMVAEQVAKHGYVGQLYEVAALTLAANPPSVNEGDAAQLSASATLDDGTYVLPVHPDLRWSVAGGPVTAISPAGVASTMAVYQNETATIEGRFGGRISLLDIAVVNSDPDNFGSYASDSIDDGWQVQHFGLDNPQAGPTNDPDADAQNNLFEYYATTNPMDAASLFQLWISRVEGRPTSKNITFHPRSPTRNYAVEYKLDLTGGSFAPLSSSAITDNGLERTVTDENATDPFRFYRVQISIP